MIIIAKTAEGNCFLFPKKNKENEIETIKIKVSDLIFAKSHLGWLELHFTKMRLYKVYIGVKDAYSQVLVYIPELYMPRYNYFFNPEYIENYQLKTYFPIMKEWGEIIPVAKRNRKEFLQIFLNMGIQTQISDLEIEKLHLEARILAKTAVGWQVQPSIG